MPIFVKAHTRAGHHIRAYSRTQVSVSAAIVRKADMLKFNLSGITGRGMFLSRPQRKAFKKAGDLMAKHQGILRRLEGRGGRL